MPLYSIVVPVYNAEKSLRILHDRIDKVFDEVIKEPFELILVDDCSKDSSYQVIRELVSEDCRVKGVQLAVNHGQQKAVLCGLGYASGDFVITMDDDPFVQLEKGYKKINVFDFLLDDDALSKL